MNSESVTENSILIHVVCLMHPEEGTEPPYRAFKSYKAAKKYAEFDLPLDLGLEEHGLKEDEEYIIYGVDLEIDEEFYKTFNAQFSELI